MQLITHQAHLETVPDSPLKTHITARFDQLYEDTEVPPNIVLVEEADDITGPDYSFVGNRGLLSDLFEEYTPGQDGFVRPYEWTSYLPGLKIYEALLLINSEDGYLIEIPEVIVEAYPGLKWVLTDESQGGLVRPQPFC